jgi:hypothetical protein
VDSYLLLRPVLAIIGTLWTGHVHEEVIAIVKIALSQANGDGQGCLAIKLDTRSTPFGRLGSTLLVYNIRTGYRSCYGTSNKTDGGQEKELHD